MTLNGIEKNMNDTADIASARETIRSMPVIFHAQYVRDISFENFLPAGASDAKGPRPVMDVSFTIEAVPVRNEQFKAMYEVQLGVKARAQRGEEAVFITEVLYSILVSLDDVPADQHHPLLFIEAPRYAFPFVRMIVSGLTQNAGLSPLLLAPVDFRALYMQRFAQDMKKNQATA